ncbi:Crp/Fnr family transcriptional regulator [soil metagenome]
MEALGAAPAGSSGPSRLAAAGQDMVRRSPWATVLLPSQLDTVLSEMQQRRVAAGQPVERCGEPVEHWMGIVDGFAKMSVASSDGRLSTLTGVGPGVWFGEGSLLKRERRRYDVLAVRPSTVALLPGEVFDWLRRTSFPFNHYLQDLLNARLSLFIGTLEHDRLVDTDARVAHALSSLFNADLYPGAALKVELGQREIGLLANVSRQRVNVALHRLQRLGLIRQEKRGVTVLDLCGLRAFAG